VREASRGLVGLDTSAHVLRLIDLDHESRVWQEIRRLSRSMSARGFDERNSAESFLGVDIEACNKLHLPDSLKSRRPKWSGRR